MALSLLDEEKLDEGDHGERYAEEANHAQATLATNETGEPKVVGASDAAGTGDVSEVRSPPVQDSHSTSAPTQESRASRPDSLGPAFTVSIVALAGLVLGSVTPWATTVLATKNGLQGDGVLTLILAVIIGVALLSYRSRPTSGAALTGLICSLIAAAIAIYDVADISSSNTRIFGQDVHVVSVGWGLWLALAASIVLAGSCFVLRRVPDATATATAYVGRNQDLERVRKLAELRDTGALSEAEFEAQKRQILPTAHHIEDDG